MNKNYTRSNALKLTVLFIFLSSSIVRTHGLQVLNENRLVKKGKKFYKEHKPYIIGIAALMGSFVMYKLVLKLLQEPNTPNPNPKPTPNPNPEPAATPNGNAATKEREEVKKKTQPSSSEENGASVVLEDLEESQSDDEEFFVEEGKLEEEERILDLSEDAEHTTTDHDSFEESQSGGEDEDYVGFVLHDDSSQEDVETDGKEEPEEEKPCEPLEKKVTTETSDSHEGNDTSSHDTPEKSSEKKCSEPESSKNKSDKELPEREKIEIIDEDEETSGELSEDELVEDPIESSVKPSDEKATMVCEKMPEKESNGIESIEKVKKEAPKVAELNPESWTYCHAYNRVKGLYTVLLHRGNISDDNSSEISSLLNKILPKTGNEHKNIDDSVLKEILTLEETYPLTHKEWGKRLANAIISAPSDELAKEANEERKKIGKDDFTLLKEKTLYYERKFAEKQVANSPSEK